METRIAELRYKEVISVEDGSRFGYVGDMEVDMDTGQVRALVVPGRRRFFGLLGREEDKYIPWSAVRRFGEDIILVEDHGRGIPAEEIPKITEAFYMVDKSRSKKAGGIGLGLALCTQIVNLHGAKMEIKSKPGVGTQIRVIFSEEQ